MSLYLGKTGRRIISFATAHPRLGRALDIFGKAAQKITFGKYTPGLTRAAFLMYQRAECGGKDTPESLARSLRLKRRTSDPRFSLRDFIYKSLVFSLGSFCANGYPLFFVRNSIVPMKMPDANFYGWFNIHDGSAPLTLEELKSVADQEKNLIIVPEGMGFVGSDEILFHRRQVAGNALSDSKLTKEAREFVLDKWIPIFLADLIADPAILDEVKNSGEASWLHYYLTQSFLLGVPLGLLTSHRTIARRKFLAYGLGGAIALGAPIVSGGKNWLSALTKPYTRDYDFTEDFRNAMIAAKILRLTAFLRGKGIKPAFLIIMGTAHREIMNNLEGGMGYNLEILGEFDSRTPSLGSYWDKGYLMDGPYFDGGHVIDDNNPLGPNGFQEIKIFEK